MSALPRLLDLHLERLRSLNFSPATIRQNRYVLKRLIHWLEAVAGVTRVDMLRKRHLRRWQEHLSKHVTTRGRPYRPRSINKHIEVARSFLQFLVAEGYIQPGLAEAIVYIKEPVVLPGSTLIHAQVRTLLDTISTDTAEGYRNRTMMEMLYSTGIRVGELLGLDMEKVDFRNRTARVIGKGRKERVVPIGQTAMHFLETYVKAVRPFMLDHRAESAVFVESGVGRMPYYTLRRIVHSSAVKAGIEINVTPHTFRRSCTTEMLRGGAGMYHVKELLGHESLETLKYYAKLTITDLKRTHAKCHPREHDKRR
jgi:integrase/recombinase XerD